MYPLYWSWIDIFVLWWIKYFILYFGSLLLFILFNLPIKLFQSFSNGEYFPKRNAARGPQHDGQHCPPPARCSNSLLHQSCSVVCSLGMNGAVTCTFIIHPEERQNWGGWSFLDSKDPFHRDLKELVVKFWTKFPCEGLMFFEVKIYVWAQNMQSSKPLQSSTNMCLFSEEGLQCGACLSCLRGKTPFIIHLKETWQLHTVIPDYTEKIRPEVLLISELISRNNTKIQRCEQVLFTDLL